MHDYLKWKLLYSGLLKARANVSILFNYLYHGMFFFEIVWHKSIGGLMLFYKSRVILGLNLKIEVISVLAHLITKFLLSVYTRLRLQSKSWAGMDDSMALFTIPEIVSGKSWIPNTVVALT